jgi:hypothetical protein
MHGKLGKDQAAGITSSDDAEYVGELRGENRIFETEGDMTLLYYVSHKGRGSGQWHHVHRHLHHQSQD